MHLIKKMLSAFWSRVAKSLAPALARTPTIFGDPTKVSIAKSAKIVNALINVQSGYIVIKDHVFFGHNVCLLTGSHDINTPGEERSGCVIGSGRNIVVEESVWLTSNVTVIGPSTIGRNSVVLPGSVVNGDIPPNTMYGGVPARFIKMVL